MNPPQPRKRPTSRQKPSKRPQNRRELIKRLREPWVAAVVGGGIAVIVVAILLISGGNDNNKSGTTTSGNGGGGTAQATKPIQANVDRLLQLATVAGHPVYWAGARPGKKYELTIDNSQNIFIRYLDPGVPIGSKDVSALTVGTYPVHNDAVAALKSQASKPGANTGSAPGGGFVLTNSNAPQSTYVAYPGSDYEIEVYDPVPGRSRSLVISGAIVPIK